METINIYALPSADEMNAMSAEEQDQLMAQIQVQRHVKGIEELESTLSDYQRPSRCKYGQRTPSPAATALPMSIGLAAGFDPELAREYGDIIGSETATIGQHVLEGPGIFYIELRLLAVTLNIFQKIRIFPG